MGERIFQHLLKGCPAHRGVSIGIQLLHGSDQLVEGSKIALLDDAFRISIDHHLRHGAALRSAVAICGICRYPHITRFYRCEFHLLLAIDVLERAALHFGVMLSIGADGNAVFLDAAIGVAITSRT